MKRRMACAVPFLCWAAAGLAGPAVSSLVAQSDTGTFRLHATGSASAAVDVVHADLAWAEVRIAEVLGVFPDTVSVRIFPDRPGFSAALTEAWGLPDTACWMVGGADDHVLYLLSPAVWGEEACDHDPGDDLHRRLLVAHEAVHVFHGQVNPSDDLGLLEDLGWFIEGLATYASGQFDRSHVDRAREAIATGVVPEHLSQAWSGPFRYGVAGSMAAFIDHRWGRQTFRDALMVTSQSALLDLLGTTEPGFLEEWESWIRAAESPRT